MALGHTLQTEEFLTLSLDHILLFVFLTVEKLSKLAVGEKATVEELLILLEEGIWNNIQQQEIKRFVEFPPHALFQQAFFFQSVFA